MRDRQRQPLRYRVRDDRSMAALVALLEAEQAGPSRRDERQHRIHRSLRLICGHMSGENGPEQVMIASAGGIAARLGIAKVADMRVSDPGRRECLAQRALGETRLS